MIIFLSLIFFKTLMITGIWCKLFTYYAGTYMVACRCICLCTFWRMDVQSGADPAYWHIVGDLDYVGNYRNNIRSFIAKFH